MPRVKVKKEVAKNALSLSEDIRFGTPELVADYRAERLQCKVIADLGCGVGFQTIAFAKTCQKVFAAEKDQRKLEYAQKNAELAGLKNIEFMHGDVVDQAIVKRLAECEIVFCDTERPLEEKRSLERISPNPVKLVEAYSQITSKMAIEYVFPSRSMTGGVKFL
ncbi:methyltransferase domain-containing protein [Candidatus Woesearchaeota archaeon]|nr:methyltransferase domain-containing protein [Candidatus Woesearchaeota archaeon]